MDKNRPVSREKKVTSGSGNVSKKGSGLKTGPVGNVSSHSNSQHSSQHTQLSGAGNGSKAGKRAGGIGGLGVVAVIVIFIIKSLLGGGSGSIGTPSQSDLYDFSNNSQETYVSSSNSTAADTTVAIGSREKYTDILGNGADTMTIMVYMCGTDLESKSGMATSDLNEMLQATLSDKVNLLVYTGGCKKWKNNVVDSNVNQIYQIKDGKFVLLEENMGKGAMTDPATLTSFIQYGTSKYPANRQALIFWDHGGGSITGFGYDEKNPGGSMNLAGIDEALSNAGAKFDFIGFDACLMATVENGLMLEKYGDYLIASEETEPGVGWYYTNWLTKLSQNTSMPTVEIGKNIVDDFVDVCDQKCRGQKTTLSVVDLAELANTVPDELTDFAKATNQQMKDEGIKKVSKARKDTREFAQSSQIDQIDLVHLCKNLDTPEAKELADAIEGAVKYRRNSSSISDTYGLSIYFPAKKPGKVKNALNIFNKIGMNSEYSKCIQEFSANESAGQFSEGGSASPAASLFNIGSAGGTSTTSTGANSDMINSLLGSLMSGGQSTEAFGLDSSLLDLFSGREVSNEETAQMIADNYFEAGNLVWSEGSTPKMVLSEEQWDLVLELELNVFVDDGEGYIDLGMDNTFDFDDDGNLIGEYDGTWLAIDGNIVPYYHENTTVYSDDSYVIDGYVPCFLNGERAELLITFDSSNPDGRITGARYVYKNGETDAVAKSITEIAAGDTVQPICDYYSYSKEYIDSYEMGDAFVLSDSAQISNIKVSGGETLATYRFTDIYNQYFWTPVIP